MEPAIIANWPSTSSLSAEDDDVGLVVAAVKEVLPVAVVVVESDVSELDVVELDVAELDVSAPVETFDVEGATWPVACEFPVSESRGRGNNRNRKSPYLGSQYRAGHRVILSNTQPFSRYTTRNNPLLMRPAAEEINITHV
jgi:hypothetical protein